MSVSKKLKDKVKKKRIDWRQVVFFLGRQDLYISYQLFRNAHLDMSINRCAYYVLKTYYSPTTLQVWKDFFESGLSYYDYEKTLFHSGDFLRSVNWL